MGNCLHRKEPAVQSSSEVKRVSTDQFANIQVEASSHNVDSDVSSSGFTEKRGIRKARQDSITKVNPMNSILRKTSTGAYVPWTHVCKVITELERLLDQVRDSDAEMIEAALKQSVKLIRNSPYIVKRSDDEPFTAPRMQSDSSLVKKQLFASSNTRTGKAVADWISDMVALHVFQDPELEPSTTGDSTLSAIRSRVSIPHIAASNALSDQISQILSQSNSWDFNVFELFDCAGSKALAILGIHVLKHYNLLTKLKMQEETLCQFLQAIQGSYLQENPYHNAEHAADVLGSTFSMLTSLRSPKRQLLQVTNTPEFPNSAIHFGRDELLATFLSAICHDVGHPGTNNDFQINTRSDLAMLYNDQSVLENYHLSKTFSILRTEGCNFIDNSSVEWRRIRYLMKEIVIHTDMQLHGTVMNRTNALPNANNADEWNEENRKNLLVAAVHACDISNPSKETNLMKEWSDRVYSEFYQQGDQERELGLKVSPIFDRLHPVREQSSVGFIQFVVQPLYESLQQYFEVCDIALENLESNVSYWQHSVSETDLLSRAVKPKISASISVSSYHPDSTDDLS